MRAAIRLAMCIVMTAPSAAAFADGYAKAGSDEEQIQQTEASSTADAKTADYDAKDADAGMGAASGEPARAESRETRAEAAQDANQQRFLNEVWTQP